MRLFSPREAVIRLEKLITETEDLRRAHGLPDAGKRLFTLKLDTSNLCNLQCKHCGVHLIRDVVNPTTMSAGLLETVADTVFPFCNEVCFGSMAEPWMSPLIEDALDLGRTGGVPVLQVVTNALLLNEKRARKLIDIQLDVLSVSTDAATPETYSRFRNGDFHQVVRNVERLRDLKNQHRSARPVIRFNFVVMRGNLHEMPDMVDFAVELGAEMIEFSMPFLDSRLNLEDEVPTRDPARWEEMMEKTRRRVEVLGLSNVKLPDIPVATTGSRLEPVCMAPWSYLSIGPTGDVYPCCSPYVLGGPPLGNLGESTIAQILTGPAHDEVRRSLVSGRLRDDCARCKATDFMSTCHLNEEYYLDVGPRLPRTGA